MTSKIVISKKWHNPQFQYVITNEDMSAEMQIDDFKKVLVVELKHELSEKIKKEISSVTWIFKDETFYRRIDAVLEANLSRIIYSIMLNIRSGIKAESSKVTVYAKS